MTARPALPPARPPGDLFGSSRTPTGSAAQTNAPRAAERVRVDRSAADGSQSSGRAEHPLRASLAPPVSATPGGSRGGSRTPPAAAVPRPAPRAAREPQGDLAAALHILASEQPVTWDAAARAWLGRPHPPHGSQVGIADPLARALVAAGRAGIVESRLVPTTEAPHAA